MPVDDSYTKVLLHMGGADASTTFTDESGKTWTANGNAQIDTATSKFGGTSAFFDGTGDYIDTPDHADFAVGTDNFTVDFWFHINAFNAGLPTQMAGQADNAGTANTRSIQVLISYSAPNYLISTSMWNSAGSSKSILGSTALSTGTWYHYALVRNGNTAYLYLNGTQEGTVDVTGFTINNSTNKFAIGRLGEWNSNILNGWIDEFRFSAGVARWTSNFTPPTSAYAPGQGGTIWF